MLVGKILKKKKLIESRKKFISKVIVSKNR